MCGDVCMTVSGLSVLSFLLQVSPQLREVFITFEQLLSNPTGCVSQMALVAQLLGERRVCKLTVQLTRDNILGLPYVVYCLEQEAVADALENIKAMVCECQVKPFSVTLPSLTPLLSCPVHSACGLSVGTGRGVSLWCAMPWL